MADMESLKNNGHSTLLVRVFQKLKQKIDTKVDKETGKGLSSEDYTFSDKTKLNGIATGAEVNQNAFSNVTVGSTTIAADSKTDTLTLVAGSNVSLTPDDTNDKITLSATDTTYTFANGENGFTVTPSGGSAQPIEVTPILEKSAINSFDDGTDSYFKKVISTIVPVQSGSGIPSPTNVRTISGFTECTVTDTNSTDTNTAIISFGSAGTVYGGTVDLTSGTLTVDREYLQPTVVRYVAELNGIYYWALSDTLQSVNGIERLLSSHFRSRGVLEAGNCYITGYGRTLIAVPTDQTLNTVALANTWLSTNQPQFVYQLATPQIYQLTPTQLRSLVGTNNLTSNTGDTVAVEYITNGTIADIYDNLNKTPCNITKLSTGIYDITIPSTARFGQRIYFQVFDTDSERLEFDGSLTVTDEAVSSDAGGGLHTSGIWYPLPSSITGNTTLSPGATFRLNANAILTTDYYIHNVIYQVTHTGTVPTPRSLYDTIKWLEDDDWLSIECYVM